MCLTEEAILGVALAQPQLMPLDDAGARFAGVKGLCDAMCWFPGLSCQFSMSFLQGDSLVTSTSEERSLGTCPPGSVHDTVLFPKVSFSHWLSFTFVWVSRDGRTV